MSTSITSSLKRDDPVDSTSQTCCIRTPFLMQAFGLLVLSLTTSCRRCVLYVVHLLIPLVCLGVMFATDLLNTEFVKPVFDTAMLEDNPFGEPQTISPTRLILPMLQNGITLGLDYNGAYVPTTILINNQTADDAGSTFYVNVSFLSLVRAWNVSWESGDEKLDKPGLEFVHVSDYLDLRSDSLDADDDPYDFVGGLLGGVVADWSVDDAFYEAHYTEEFSSLADFVGDATATSSSESSSAVLDANGKNLSPLLGALEFFMEDGHELSYTLVRETGRLSRREFPTLISSLDALKNNYSTGTSFCRLAGLASLTFECGSVLSTLLISTVDSAFILDRVGVKTNSFISQMPYESEGMLMKTEMGDGYVLIMLPFMLSILLPLFVFEIVRDKESGARTQMALMGLSPVAYRLVRSVVFYLFYVLFVLVFVTVGFYVFQFRVFTQVSPGLLALILVGNGFCLLAFSFLFSTFFQSAFLALFAGFFASIILPSFSSRMRINLMKNSEYNWPSVLFYALKALLLLFPVQIVETIGLLREPLLSDAFIPFSFLYQNTDMLAAVLSLFVGPVVMTAASFYLQSITNQPHQLKKSPFFIFEFFLCGCCRCLCPTKCNNRKNYPELAPDYVEDDAVREERERIAHMGPEELKQYGLVLRGIGKKFPGASHYSVRAVNLSVRPGECLGLLGKNGAGKTTTIRCITSQIRPTCGTAYVCGMDIRKHAGAIRKRVGVCEQFDSLFEELTPEETLLFYARLRGVLPWKQKDHVRDVLRAVGLLEEEEEKEEEGGSCGSRFRGFLNYVFGRSTVKNLNAGSKRRLSIGVAVVGNPEVLYLDEPTTGLDHAAKAKIWQVVHRLKARGHCVVITTHSMQEAEELSDRVAIMSLGRLKAIGSLQYLKENYGQGVSIDVRAASSSSSPSSSSGQIAERFVDRILWDSHTTVSHDDFDCSHISWNVLDPETLVVSEVFSQLQRGKEEGILVDWRYRENTLEDVFVALVEKDETGAHAVEQRLRKHIVTLESEIVRMKKDHKSQNVKPASVFEEGEEEEEESSNSDDASGPLLMSKTKTSSSPSSSVGIRTKKKKKLLNVGSCASQLFHMLRKHFFLAYRNAFEFAVQLSFGAMLPLLLAIIFWIGAMEDTRTYFPSIDAVPSLLTDPCYSSIPGAECYQFVYATNGHLLAEEVMNHTIFTHFGGVDAANYTMNNNNDSTTAVREFDNSTDMLDWIFENPNRTLAAIDFNPLALIPPGIPYIEWTIYVNRTSLGGVRGDVIDVAPALQVMLDNAVLFVRGEPDDSIYVRTRDTPLFPLKESSSKYTTYKQMGIAFSVMCSIFVLIYAVFSRTQDKESGLLEFLSMMGLQKIPAFLSYAIWYVLFALVSSLLTYVVFYLVENPIIRNQNFLLAIGMLLMFALTQLAFSSMILPFLNTMRAAQLFALTYLMGNFLLTMIVNSELVFSLYSLDHPDANEPWFVVIKYVAIPLLSPAIICAKIYVDVAWSTIPIFDYATRTHVDNTGFSFNELMEEKTIDSLGLRVPATGYFYLLLLADCVIYMLVGALVSMLLSRCYCCSCGRRKKKKSKKTHSSVRDGRSNDDEIVIVVESSADGPSKKGLELRNVSKRYDAASSKVLKKFNLTVPEGCLVSLVGPCGSGKTTCMRLITGGTRLFPKGDVFVNGLSLKTNLSKIRSRMGYVPQHCVLVGQLTAVEMLELCAACRGVPPRKMSKEVDELIRRVNLSDCRNDQVGTFSGGMKRRLSVAISLIGSPEILLLDEPSTGVDPYSKFQIWNLLRDFKGSKTILMTSHELDEAEALSDLIAVLDDRHVSFMGSSLELKKKLCRTSFDIRIEILDVESASSRLEKFMSPFLPQAVLVSSMNTTFIYRIDSDDFRTLVGLIKALERHCLKSISINGSSPEFLASTSSSSSEKMMMIRDIRDDHHHHREVVIDVREEEEGELPMMELPVLVDHDLLGEEEEKRKGQEEEEGEDLTSSSSGGNLEEMDESEDDVFEIMSSSSMSEEVFEEAEPLFEPVIAVDEDEIEMVEVEEEEGGFEINDAAVAVGLVADVVESGFVPNRFIVRWGITQSFEELFGKGADSHEK